MVGTGNFIFLDQDSGSSLTARTSTSRVTYFSLHVSRWSAKARSSRTESWTAALMANQTSWEFAAAREKKNLRHFFFYARLDLYMYVCTIHPHGPRSECFSLTHAFMKVSRSVRVSTFWIFHSLSLSYRDVTTCPCCSSIHPI
jgi:hypothetical protein